MRQVFCFAAPSARGLDYERAKGPTQPPTCRQPCTHSLILDLASQLSRRTSAKSAEGCKGCTTKKSTARGEISIPCTRTSTGRKLSGLSSKSTAKPTSTQSAANSSRKSLCRGSTAHDHPRGLCERNTRGIAASWRRLTPCQRASEPRGSNPKRKSRVYQGPELPKWQP